MSRSSAKPSDIAVRSWLSVVRAYHLCSELMATRLSSLGVKTSEHELLVNLMREPGLSQQALASRCFTAKSHISGLLSDLERRGLITRTPHPTDGRAKSLNLTAEGELLALQTAEIQAEVVNLMTAGVDGEDLHHLQLLMTQVSDRLHTALTAHHLRE